MPSRISCSVGAGVVGQQVDAGHDHAGRAVAALQAVLFPERLLQRVQAIALGAGPRWWSRSEPSAWTAKMVHDLALRPSTSTVHAPHWLVSQPTWVPVKFNCSRRKWTSSIRGSTCAVRRLPFTVMDTRVIVAPRGPPSLQQAGDQGSGSGVQGSGGSRFLVLRLLRASGFSYHCLAAEEGGAGRASRASSS